MGNYLACTLAKATMGGSSNAVKVVLPDGRIRRFNGPVSAAELMLDAPGNFLTEAGCMRLGQRLTAALSADEELELAKIYIMLPMNRLNAIATTSDMARLLVLANKEAKRVPASARVQPDSAALQVPKTVRLDQVDDEEVAAEIGEFKHRLSCGKSRKPSLETIQEENFNSRL